MFMDLNVERFLSKANDTFNEMLTVFHTLAFQRLRSY